MTGQHFHPHSLAKKWENNKRVSAKFREYLIMNYEPQKSWLKFGNNLDTIRDILSYL